MDPWRTRGDPDRIVYDSTQTILIGASTELTTKKGPSSGSLKSPEAPQILEYPELQASQARLTPIFLPRESGLSNAPRRRQAERTHVPNHRNERFTTNFDDLRPQIDDDLGLIK
jgi:hypothetical protein